MEGVDPWEKLAHCGWKSPLPLPVGAQACFAFGSERQIRDTGKPSGPSTG
jgi:hypothetical protein